MSASEAKESTVNKPTRSERRRAERLRELAKLPTGEAFEAATSMAATAAHKRQIELEKGSKVTRRERAEILRNMSASIQACANVGYRIKQGISPTGDMMASAMQQPETLALEIASAAEHAPQLAQQVARDAGLENLAAALASDATAATSTPPHQYSPAATSQAMQPENQAGALASEASAATCSPPLQEQTPAQPVENKALPVKLGRPSTFTEAEGERICQWIQSGKSLNSYCKEHGRQASTIYHWMTESVSFAQNYGRAHEDRADTLVEDMLDIADSVEKADNIVQVMAGKLRIETRRWIAERMRPEKYGNKVQVDHAATVTFQLGVPKRDEQKIIDINPVQPRLDKA